MDVSMHDLGSMCQYWERVCEHVCELLVPLLTVSRS